MLMLSCTDSLRPGLGRIGKLGDNITLPRTVDAYSAIGAVVGAFVGGFVGFLVPFFHKATTVVGVGGVGLLIGVMVVQARPWAGEHIGRVAVVRFRARAGVVTSSCPGSGRLSGYVAETGQHICSRCGFVVEPDEGLSPAHQWRRRLYTGIMPVPHPQTGPIEFCYGSVPVSEPETSQWD